MNASDVLRGITARRVLAEAAAQEDRLRRDLAGRFAAVATEHDPRRPTLTQPVRDQYLALGDKLVDALIEFLATWRG